MRVQINALIVLLSSNLMNMCTVQPNRSIIFSIKVNQENLAINQHERQVLNHLKLMFFLKEKFMIEVHSKLNNNKSLYNFVQYFLPLCFILTIYNTIYEQNIHKFKQSFTISNDIKHSTNDSALVTHGENYPAKEILMLYSNHLNRSLLPLTL